jgi:hypothetical protein
MLARLLLERNDIGEVESGLPLERSLHEFQPNGKCGAGAGFFLAK